MFVKGELLHCRKSLLQGGYHCSVTSLCINNKAVGATQRLLYQLLETFYAEQ